MTKKQLEQRLRYRLATETDYAIKGLLIVNQNQTDFERQVSATVSTNGVGFTKFDGKAMGLIAKHYLKYGRITEKMRTYVLTRMPSYFKQVLASEMGQGFIVRKSYKDWQELTPLQAKMYQYRLKLDARKALKA